MTGDYVTLTGTTTVTDITLGEGKQVTCVAESAFTLTDGSGNSPQDIILPTGSNIDVEAGDVFTVRGEQSGAVRVVNYMRADGSSLSGSASSWTYLSSQALTSGTSKTLTIPAGAKEVVIKAVKVSTNGTSNIGVTLNAVTSGYLGLTQGVGVTSSVWGAFANAHVAVAAANTHDIYVNLRLVDEATDTWSIEVMGSTTNTTGTMCHGIGHIVLGSELSSVEFTMANGTDAFDGANGVLYCMWR